jgi:hypothetical protein
MLLNFPSLYKHLFVCKAHRKRLVILILLPSIMQWIPVNWILYWAPPLSLQTILRQGRAWLSLMLGAAFSCSLEGDGPRSPSTQLRRNRARRAKYLSKVVHRRTAQVLDRTGTDASLAPALAPAPPSSRGNAYSPEQSTPPTAGSCCFRVLHSPPRLQPLSRSQSWGQHHGLHDAKGRLCEVPDPPPYYSGTVLGHYPKA